MKFPDPRRLISGLFPILQWSKSYNGDAAIGDLISGVTIALTLIPQSIAYASLAGFEPQYGLYASFAGGFVYAMMGTCPQINIGPTALLSLMTFTYTNGTSPEFAVLLCFVAGIVQLIAGIAQLGFLVEFVSTPVVSGFTSAAAITIASSQIKGLLGLRFSAESFLGTWMGVFNHIQDTRMQDTLLSLVCCIILLGMKALKDIKIRDPENEKSRRAVFILQKSLWFAGVARNAVVVVAAAVVAFFVHQDTGEPLILTGKITAGLPQPSLPPFSASVGNTTYTAGDMFGHLGSGLIVVPLVGIISNVAIAKAFARGRTLDATQEIVALGACNLVGAFFKSFPVNGSFTRSAVSDASGVRTPAAGFYTGFIVLLTLALLTPYFYFIPRAALASVIVCAVLHMVDINIIKRLWNCSRLDLIPLVGTFVCCLALGIEVGLICGVGIDVLLILYYHSRPPLDIKFVDDGTLPPHYSIHPIGGLNFAGAERVRSKIMSLKHAKKPQQQRLETLRVIPDNDYNSNIVRNNINSDRTPAVTNEDNIRGESGQYVNGNGLNVQSEVISDNAVNGGLVGRTNDSQYDIRDIRRTSGDSRGQSQDEGLRTEINLLQIGGHLGTNVARNSYKVLVIHCDELYRMDYTFLQSLKMLVGDWSRSGPIIWCNVRPYVKKQLDSELTGLVYCQSEQLGTLLSDLYIGSLRETLQADSCSDTQL